MEINERILQALKTYFEGRDDIAFAFLFGSAARGKVRHEGDVDVAVYFKPEKDVEWEAFGKTYKGENRIALDLERLVPKQARLESSIIVGSGASRIITDKKNYS